MALTSQQILRKRILRVLRDFDKGSAPRKVVLAELDGRFGSSWTPEDRSSPKSRPFEQNWMNRASYERANMVREGLLTDGASGLWTLTELGRQVAEQA
ncbi:MAG: winged helix-turn-helix domain-containing protein [Marmoricola sp.]